MHLYRACEEIVLVIMITTDIYILLHVIGDVEVTRYVQGMNAGCMQMLHHFTSIVDIH